MSEIEWVKLPHDLQHKFFERAEQETVRMIKTLDEFAKELSKAKEIVLPHLKNFKVNNERFRVAAIDGSRSPRLSQRLGIRYGVFAVGATYLYGNERQDEYAAGIFKRSQALSHDESTYMFDILTTFEERRFAKEALSKADFVIIDGSFYGFLYTAMKMLREGYGSENHLKVVKDTFDITKELIESRRVIGVIKRSRTRAIGGYLAAIDPNNRLSSVIDKLVLSAIMPAMSVFEYEKLIGKEPVPVYSRIASVASRGLLSKDFVEEARNSIYRSFEEFELPKESYSSLRRMQVRNFETMPPCEIEFPEGMREDVFKLISQDGFFNQATNLPMALDLVDSSVNLSAKFVDEFTDEVQSRLMETFASQNTMKETARIFFELMNPQKEF